MAISPSATEVGFELETERRVLREQSGDDDPFLIAFLGGFAGSRNREGGIATRRRITIDRDNFDQVLARFEPEVELAIDPDTPPVKLSFRDIDDFHPDRIWETAEVFQPLRELRKRIANPATFEAAAREMRRWHQEADAAPGRPEEPATPRQTSGNLLDEILSGGNGSAIAPSTRTESELSRFLRKAVEPHLIPSEKPEQREMLRQIDDAIAAQMRAILHHPRFQEVESLWRAVFLLIRRLETGPSLKVQLLDIGKDELKRDLLSGAELPKTETYRLLVENTVGTPGAIPWAVLATNYSFGPDAEDVAILERLGEIARLCGAPLLAEAESRVAGCDSFTEASDPDTWNSEADPTWERFRRTRAAAQIGLAAPRVLLRLPYGEDGEPCESIRFEEMPAGKPDPASYCWGNPAALVALLLGQSFAEYGARFRPGVVRDVDHLPLHVYELEGESISQPCGEMLLTERAADRLLERGIMPIASMKDSDTVRVVRFQSVADPATALAGRWA